MIPFEDAYKKVIEASRLLDSETVTLEHALNRILAQDVVSDVDMPPFNKSAMDGYACKRSDLKNGLKVLETIPAGEMPTCGIGEGECSKIMTGAVVPEGADCVIMVEHTETCEDGKIIFTGKDTADNICIKAEDIRCGDTVLMKGELIGPAELAVLATVGCSKVTVAQQPKVGVIVTGSELVEPTEEVEGAKIRNSNGYQICAQTRQMGCIATYCGIVGDTEDEIDSVVKQAMISNDLIVLSGGVSMGDFDLVPGVLKKNGFTFIFESVAMQPGRPTIFGKSSDTYCCGLPGNPVSTFIVFEIMLKPFLYRLMGMHYEAVEVPLPLGKSVKRRKTVRQSSLPVQIRDGKVFPVEYHGSAHINAMSVADGIIRVPIGVSELKEETVVNVRLI